MITSEVLSFVKLSRANGMTDAAIKQVLLNTGWNDADADAILRGGTTPLQPVTPVQQPTPAAQPVAAAPSQSFSSIPSTATHHDKKKKVLVIAGIAVVVMLGGAIAYGYSAGLPPFGKSDDALMRALPEKILSIDWMAYKSEFSFKAEPRESDTTHFDPSLLSSSLPIPVDAQTFGSLSSGSSLVFTVSGASKTEDPSNRDTKLAIGGAASFGDFNMEAAAEFITKDDAFYVQLNKFPSLFLDFSAIKGKWVKIAPDDIKNALGFGGIVLTGAKKVSTEQEVRAAELSQQALTLYKIAVEESLVTFKRVGTEGRVRIFHATIDGTRASDFYRRATAELASYGSSSIMQFDQETANQLASNQFAQVLDYLQKNLTIEYAIDSTTGYPTRIVADLRMAIATIKPETQFRMRFSTEFSDINKPSPIEAPAESISFEEASFALSGKTREEYLDDKQISQVRSIQTALELYFVRHGVYPETLIELTRTDEALSYTLLNNLPNDVHTKNPYLYRRDKDNFSLTYTLISSQPTYIKTVVGTNTATNDTISVEGAKVK